MNELPWSERINMLSINPEAASVRDVARMAAELIEANAKVAALQEAVREYDRRCECWDHLDCKCVLSTLSELRSRPEVVEALKEAAHDPE